MTNSSVSYPVWKQAVDKIAAEEGFKAMKDAPPSETMTWKNHFNNGLTPQQAWNATPYWRRP